MRLHQFRPLERGEVSILAAFVLVVILAGTGLFFQSFSPVNQQSQTAASVSAVTKTVAKEKEIVKGSTEDKCQKAIAACQANPSSCAATKNTKAPKKSEDATDDCVAAVPDSGRNPPFRCVGKSATVLFTSDSLLDIKAAPNSNVEPGKCKITACKPSGGVPASPITGGMVYTSAQCFVSEDLKTIDKDSIVKGLASSEAFSVSRTVFGSQFTPNSPLDENTQRILNAAFGKSPDSAPAIYLNSDGDLAAPAAAQIAKYAADNPDQAALDASKKVTDALKLNSNLATDPSTLGTDFAKQFCLNNPDEPGCNGIPKPGDVKTCPAGQTGSPPNCTPASRCQGGNCGTFPDGNKITPDTNGNKSGVESMLKGLMQGLSRALASPPPAAPAAAAQACSTDPNVYAQQQQQYQQQLQQYNYQLQQYQYQQQVQQYYAQQQGGYGYAPPQQPLPAQPTPCRPSTQNQCATQPAQPNPAACSLGSWQPIYSGNCILNWQCSNLGAQLSCEPKKADIGMQLAITYSCAQGTAVGDGFTASGQSGVATTTVGAPPSGTNTATYRLTCQSGTQTSGAQCSVQVTLPSIVLVGNPATISAGQTSQLGWVTVGMQACTISSPQDAAFTAQNASNTSVSGTATTIATSTTTSYLLHCDTLAGGTKDATTTVTVQ